MGRTGQGEPVHHQEPLLKTLLIDNYDSFTFNLFQLLADVNGEEPLVVRNDGATWRELDLWDYDNIVISPGPGRPERPRDFGVCADALRSAAVPLLGVCLGHQGLGYVSGGTVVHAPEVMHGRLSAVYHDDSALFAGMPQGFEAVQYYSLCVAQPPPLGLEVTAWTDDGVIMGLRDVSRPRWGVQFHPESICTSHGRTLIENFHDLTKAAGTRRRRRSPGRSQTIVPTRYSPDPPDAAVPRFELRVRTLSHLPDLEDIFVRLFADDPCSWWLDSSRADGDSSRFSFMGGTGGPHAACVTYDVAAQEVTVVRGEVTETHRETILGYLQREIDALAGSTSVELPFDFDCGFVGYLGYEVKADCGGSLVHRSSLPDAAFQFADRMLAFDHRERTTYVLCLVDADTTAEGEAWLDRTVEQLEMPAQPVPAVSGGRGRPIHFRLSRPYEQYLADIARCHEYLADGETYEVCLTNKVLTDVVPEPLDLYRIVRRVNPAPFSAFLRYGDTAVACSSPERFLRIDRDRRVEARPIKGTARRGATPAEDTALAEALRTDVKNRAENLMITDLLRNDLGLVCEIGSVHVPHLFAVETYETVHQLVSTIRGRLRAGLGVTDCIRACFPGGSMTGAPKRRTMEIIDELEHEARGVYSGAIGYLGLGGGIDLNIVIRTIVVEPQGTSIGTGGAIVTQSDAELEYEETILKTGALTKAIVLCVGADDGHDGGAAVAVAAQGIEQLPPRQGEAPRAENGSTPT